MDGTANLVEREPNGTRGATDVIALPRHEMNFELPWITSIARELIRPQGGLEVEWSDGQPSEPRASLGRNLALSIKRLVDICGSASGLLFLAPLLLIIAVWIKLTDKGPIFFRQSRVGLDGRTFEILKFRSMYTHLGDATGVAQTVANDSRVTPIGSFIRKTSIDELPQLINVLRGDMSLVGPRPHVAGMLAGGMRYEDLVPHYGFRHRMRPGLTGWAQCQGLRGPTVDRSKALARVGHDFAYVQNFSLWLDIKILAKTVASELLSSNAH